VQDHPFPLPWIVKEITGGYSVLDAKGTSLAHFYVRKGQVERDDARLLALNFSRLPAMLGATAKTGSEPGTETDLAWWNGSLATG
jgi:hypothetical protein